MGKDLVVLKTQIYWNSFGNYGKNLEKPSDEKEEKQKQKSEAFIKEAITSSTTTTFDDAMNFYLPPWVVKPHSLKLLPVSYGVIICPTTPNIALKWPFKGQTCSQSTLK
jgi:hypothetical protein